MKDFRNYQHLVLDFDQGRTLIVGENGKGKSTIFDAMQWLLTGQCRGVDGKGAGQKDLIRLGADSMTVTGVFDGLGPVSRSISRNGSATTTMPTDVILGKLDTTTGMLASVLSGRAFFTMHHADAKAMLMQLLNVQIPKDKLPGVDLPDTVPAADLATLEQLFEKAFQDRKLLKAELAGVHVPDQPKVVAIDLGGKTLADVQQQLKKRQGDLATMIRDQAQAEHQAVAVRGKHTAAVNMAASLEQLRGVRTTHQDMLTRHQAELATATADLATAEAEPAEPVGALDIQLREAATLIDKIDRHRSAIIPPGTIPKTKKAARAVADRPTDAGHTCVLGGGIPCLTAASEFTGAIDQLRASQKDMEARIKAGNERARKVAAAQQAVRESERHVSYHQGQVQDAEAKIAAAVGAAGEVQPLADAAAAADAAVVVGTKAVAEVRADIDTMQRQVGDLASYEQAQRQHQQQAQRKAALDKRVQQAENLVALLGPKGIRLQYLDAALADFLAAVNAALEPFGFDMAINVEPWRVEVNQGQGAVRFDLLSKGQQLWTGLAFQLTLAALSGLDFAVLDDAEAVVGLNRAVLTELILGAPVQQVLVAMAKSDDEPVPDIDGLQVVRVGDVQTASLA